MYAVNLISHSNEKGKYGEIHSAWNTFDEAKHQKEVLMDSGYKQVSIQKCPNMDCENGSYFL